jgi:hypothetical protein
MIDIFSRSAGSARNYILPSLRDEDGIPAISSGRVFEGGMRTYLVSKMLAGFTHPTFKPGVVVTRWSGVPIDRAVDVNADRQGGAIQTPATPADWRH